MKILWEFRDFAMRWNVVDLAVGVIIGSAFGKIVSSIVEDVIMPVIARIVGAVDFSNLYYGLWANIPSGLSLVEARKLWPVLAYGNFLTIVINFIIIAFCIFLIVKIMMKAMPKKTVAPKGPTDVEILIEIRNLLKKTK